MIAILAGVPGKLKALLDRLTSTRAANLDKLDANITTRAAASTALTNTVWTDARAANLDLPPLRLKSIQSGVINIADGSSSATATISSVNTAKSVLLNLGTNGIAVSGSTKAVGAYLTLDSATTVRATKGTTAAGTSLTVSWQVVEFE